MWKLTIEDDEGRRTLLPLVRDEYRVGRDEQNTIRLTDRNISRQHATLKKNGGEAWHIIDHDSYNGCYVNGQRVAGHSELQHSDVIQVGDYRIFLTNDEAADGASEPKAGSASITSPQPVMQMPLEKPDRLIVLVGPEPGIEYRLDEGPVTIGRAEECKASVNHPSVSRVHAEVKPIGNGRYEVWDKGSSNGVRVNGTEFRRRLLEGGDLIELGDVKLRFVEQGQIYRPHADVSQAISALSSKPSQSARPPAFRSNKGLIVGALLGVVVLGGIIAVSTGDKEPDKTPTATPAEDPAAKALDVAKKAAEAGDYATAFTKLSEIPEASPIRQNPDFAALHNRWADWMLNKVVDLSDKAEKRQLLTRVAQNTVVDAERRKKASDLLAALDSPGTDISSLPKGVPTTTAPATGQAGGTAPPTTAAPTADPGSQPAGANPDKPVAKKDPKDPAPADKPAAPSGPVDPTSPEGEMKMRKMLEGKMNGGKATKEDLKMLKAICQHQGDAACKARANDAIKKLQ